jgi:hypothetical protein
MRLWGKLRDWKRNMRERIENAFGKKTRRTCLEVRREILEQVESRIATDANRKRFPYAKAIVWLQPTTEVLRNVFEVAFMRDGSLKKDILELLKGANARLQEPFEAIVKIKMDLTLDSEATSPGPLFQLDFIAQDPSIGKEVPEAGFVISKGMAEQQSYKLKKKRILIGRSYEVLDREGRLVRKNDVIFLDNGDDVNSTVDRAHARIWFDFEKNEFCIMDDVSRLGTIIMREGRSIEVPAGNPHGIGLQSGDAIYCGQACLHFESTYAIN